MAANSCDTIKTDISYKDKVKHFGSFKVMLADILTFATVMKLANLFEYPPRIIEELNFERKENIGNTMIRYMEDRGQIQHSDISPLLNGLKALDLIGTDSTVRKLFEEHTGIRIPEHEQSVKPNEGKRCSFADFLRERYSLWYNKIQPIPYIRDKMYCVNDVYVEGGIKVVKTANAVQGGAQGSFKEDSRSFSDLFDSRKIPTNRILLQGDPGYGKSTFTLQAAYEWCSRSESSPLKYVEIFILLPLRFLRNLTSFYECIRLVLLPPEATMTDSDIKEILLNCSSGVIVLDGYDEYPDKEKGTESDVIEIIKGTMFANFKVIVTARPFSIPRDPDPTTVTLKLTGFDDRSMYEYIKRAVTGGNEKEAQKIKDILSSSPVLADICEVPIFCVLFAHITHEQSHTVSRFSSVTSFFRYIMWCFYSHMREKHPGKNAFVYIPDYPSLNKLAFESLIGETQLISWPKKDFIRTIGRECFRELSAIGILVEETILEVSDEPGVDINQHIRYKEFVRFYHKLFVEWYAGIYLSSYAGGFWPIWLNYTLDKINPVDLQYVFRFASGLNMRACYRIIRYLQGLSGGSIFASLCLFEQSMDQEKPENIVEGLCSDGMTIRSTDNKLLQRSSIQLLNIASRQEIPVSRLTLDKSLVNVESDELTLNNGLPLPALRTLQELEIKSDMGEEYSTETFCKLLTYGQLCGNLNHIYFIGCLLPVIIEVGRLFSTAGSFKPKVFWRPFKNEFSFDFLTGTWNLTVQQSSAIQQISPVLCSEILAMFSGELTLLGDDSEDRQKTMAILLETAIKQNVGIPTLVVNMSLLSDNKRGINTMAGYRLPNSLETLEVREKTGKEIDLNAILRIIGNLQKYPNLKTLIFSDCLLPLSFPEGTLSFPFQTRSFQVCWRPSELEFCLDFVRRRWMLKTDLESVCLHVNDQLPLSKKCKETIYLRKTDSEQIQRSEILLLEIASSHKIPIAELNLRWSFRGFDGDNIRLESGLCIPSLASVDKISINGDEGEQRLTEEEVTGLISFGMKSERFRGLWFHYCKLPPFIKPASLTAAAKTRNIKVISSNEAVCLCMECGEWREPEDIQTIATMCSGNVIIDKDTSEPAQRSVIELLVKASNLGIPISMVTLALSFDKIDEDGLHIILKSGLSIPPIPSMKILTIQTEKRRDMKEEVTAILNYVQRNEQLKDLSLQDCVLPSQIRLQSASTLKSRNVNVFWTPDVKVDVKYYSLDLVSGHWEKVGDW